MQNENFTLTVEMKQQLRVVVYRCYVKSFVYMGYLNQQEHQAKDYIYSKTEWKIIGEYDDGETDQQNPFQRKEFKRLCQDIMYSKLNNCKIAILSAEVIAGISCLKLQHFISRLSAKGISLFFINGLGNTADIDGTFLHGVQTFVADNNKLLLDKVFVLLSGNNSNKSSGNEYKCNFTNVEHLKNILRQFSLKDNWVNIISLTAGSMRFECTENQTISDDIEKIIEFFQLECEKIESNRVNIYVDYFTENGTRINLLDPYDNEEILEEKVSSAYNIKYIIGPSGGFRKLTFNYTFPKKDVAEYGINKRKEELEIVKMLKDIDKEIKRVVVK